eukprot:CAMPEP_0119105810 /NCGR_PEP_ID=MMETSP1180-20130426/3676_1 /TAXON_ID=3052 ORGANISM="Chlamydomonas cf sp, Strain CCMP681" /NCGR_SAMPLE_ID=MMETSP1180 /ASSEMBLY_ACC=CAM_ASM_000741 /LENGTH=268 /DNA_ID=CAMNT_0007090965 /DNA_START=13 /DNA_END=816 /DNA_ORIENTATION=-
MAMPCAHRIESLRTPNASPITRVHRRIIVLAVPQQQDDRGQLSSISHLDQVLISRRAGVASLMAAPLMQLQGMWSCAQASDATGSAVSSAAPPEAPQTALVSSSQASVPLVEQPQLFKDEEYTLLPPPAFDFMEIPYPVVERGPSPERNPVRCRFQAPGDTKASVSVVVRTAQALTFSFTQVGDIAQLGDPEAAAKLVVPKGSLLISATQEVDVLPPRETPLGQVDVPPKTYYRYEIITPAKERIYLSVAAARGKIFVCGGAAPVDEW